MKKPCKQCGDIFDIKDKDQAFYKKIDVPQPTLCQACREQRRLLHRNERTLYSRQCDLCKKNIISIYPPASPVYGGTNANGPAFPVYCITCWWSDKWAGTDYAKDYDPSRPFLDQFKELQQRVPRIGILSMNSVNSDYTNNTADNKNCYLIFAAENNEDCYYGRLVQTCRSVVDCDYIYESERCYGCSDIRKCYNTMFSERCQSSTDILFGFNLSGCLSCILCANLRNKSYCIENKQCTKEEYERKRDEILASSHTIEAAKKKFDEMKSQVIVKFANNIKCEDSTGDYLFNCRRTTAAFDATNAQDCAYVADALDPKDFFDGNNIYYQPELCYEVMGCLKLYDCKFSVYVFYASGLLYCDSVHHTNNAIGCIGLKKNEYCILNKQYSKEDYEKLKPQIIEHLKRDGVYGELMGQSCSPFGYNETHAMTYYPLTKEECVSRGWRWQDNMPGTFQKETIKPENVPSKIEDVKDEIVNEILACSHCGKNYKITKQELAFYRSMHLPLPLIAPECRLLARMSRRNPRKLWHRQCMCSLSGHGHHADGVRCINVFETAYAPERPEKVFCEVCYQKEVI